jgi:F0F1-type ATP synthase alpha subunit
MLFNLMENLNFNLGRVISIGDGVAQIDGLSSCMSEELILFFTCYTFFIFNSKKIKNLFLALPIVSTECCNRT